MTADSGVEGGVGEIETLDVHDLESGVLDGRTPRQLDHPAREVDAYHLSVRRHQRGEPPAEVARTAGKVEDAHSGPRLDKLDHARAPPRFAVGHDAFESLLVRLGMAAEDVRKELLRLHGRRPCHSISNVAATPIVEELVRPTTWIPTGNPVVGAGKHTTGCPVVLKGRVNRVSGSRTSSPALTGGATIAVAGTMRASMPSMARRAASRSRGSASRAASKSTARTSSPRWMRATTSAPYFSGNCFTHSRCRTAASTSKMVSPTCASSARSGKSPSETPAATESHARAVSSSRSATHAAGTASRGTRTRSTG